MVEHESQPYDQCPNPYVSDGSPVCEPGSTQCPCVYVDFLDLDMKGPVYLYYKMENFYQNHRRYKNQALFGNVVQLCKIKEWLAAGRWPGTNFYELEELRTLQILQ